MSAMSGNRRAQVQMTPEEVAAFVAEQRTATIATQGRDGAVHLVAMWYAVLDGEVWFETKARSQKVANLRRDDRLSVLVEAGHTYDRLRGVALEGHAEVVEDPEVVWRVCREVVERYLGPYSEELRPVVDDMARKRVAVRLVADRTRSWDHRKLGLPPMEVTGTTAPAAGAP